MAIAAVAGMGGIGKTALAQEYVRRYKVNYPGGRWYFKVREQELSSQILEAAAYRGWQVPDNLSAVKRVQWCYEQWVSEYPGQRRLLLIDDVVDYEAIQPFLPEASACQVLITTRKRLGTPVNRLDLDTLLPLDAFKLLWQQSQAEKQLWSEQLVAESICEWLGYLPLGIELVGRYLAEVTIPLSDLLVRLQASRLSTPALRDVPGEMAYKQDVVAAFELSWRELLPETKWLAGLLSIFALAPISPQLIDSANNPPQPTLSQPHWMQRLWRRFWPKPATEKLSFPLLSTNHLEAAARSLVKLNLVRRDEEGAYQLHQLVREFIREKLETELAAQKTALQTRVANGLTAIAKQIPPTITVSIQAQVKDAIPHMALVAQFLTHLITDTDAVWPYIGLARFYRGQSLWPEAKNAYQACLAMTEQRFGAEHPDTATSLNNLAGLYASMGRYPEAEPLYQRSLEIREAQLGAEHPHTATSLNNLAGLYESMGRYPEAGPLYRRSLEISEAQLGAEHPHTATSLNNLAGLYESMGRYPEVEPLYQRSLEIREAQLGAEHPHTALSLNNLATLYYAMGRYPEAEPLYRRSLEIREAQLGAEHPHTATSLNNLAALYYAMSRYPEAEPLLQRSLEIREAQLGAEHPDTALSLNNLAALYYAMGRYPEAEPLLQRSLEIREAQLGAEHPDTASSLSNLADLYESMGRYPEAEPLYAQAVSVWLQVLGQDHPNTRTGINNFAGCLQQAIAAGQVGQLSDHRLTQGLLQIIQQGQ